MQSRTARTLLIVLGVALLAIVVIPLLFMVGMGGMMSTMMGDGQCCGGMAWAGVSVGVLVVLGAIGLIVFALRRPS